MFMRNFFIIFILILFSLVFNQPVITAESDYGLEKSSIVSLNLSPEQEKQAAEIRKHSREMLKPLFEELKKEKTELKYAQKSSDKKRIEVQKKRIAAIKEKISFVRNQNIRNIELILTIEQKIIFDNNLLEIMRKNNSVNKSGNTD